MPVALVEKQKAKAKINAKEKYRLSNPAGIKPQPTENQIVPKAKHKKIRQKTNNTIKPAPIVFACFLFRPAVKEYKKYFSRVTTSALNIVISPPIQETRPLNWHRP